MDRRLYSEHRDDFYTFPKSLKENQIDDLCDTINKTGNNIYIKTYNGLIHVFFNGKEVQNVTAVNIGVDLCISFLAGILYGITSKK